MTKKNTLGFFILALSLATVGGAYYLYVSDRESYFVDRNFRLLALWSKKLSETVDEYKNQLQYIISASSPNGDESDQCKGENTQRECQPARYQENVNKECDCKNPFLHRFEKKFEDLNKKLEGKLISVSICKSDSLTPNKFVNDQPHIKAQISSKDKDFLRLTYEREYERKRKEARESWKDTIEVDLSISKVVRYLITDQAFNDTIVTDQAFSDVIVFDSEKGTVHFQANHFQDNHSSFRIDDFRDLVAQRPDTEGIFSFFSDNSESKGGRRDKTGSSAPPLKDLLQNPTHREITVGEVSYELFTQPIVLPQLTFDKQMRYNKKDGPARLILAGLVKTKKFQSEYRAIPHTWLLIFLLFVLLGLLSLPIIHLGLMDSREPLRPMHVLSLLVVCVAGTALITLLFLDVVWLNNVRDSLNEQLKETADDINKVFKNELEKTLDLLRAYDHSDTFEDDFTCATKSEKCPVSYFTYPHTCAEEGNRKCGEVPNGKWVARKEYPYLCDEKHKEAFPYHCNYDVVFWVDRDKNTRITWTTKSNYHLEASVSLAHRDYVNRVLDSDPKSSLWHDEYGRQFYAESLHSLRTGKHAVILSMESCHGKQEDPCEAVPDPAPCQKSSHCKQESPSGKKPTKWVAAIIKEFHSLDSLVIPSGTGFAVIEDEGGKVLFHSDDSRSLWENFFEETDDNTQLKAHIFSRTAGEFQGTYWGKGHSFYSTPLPDVPWSLVVFRNKELFRTTNFEALLLAGTLFALYTVFSTIVVLAVIWLCRKVRRRKMSMSWFWPDSKRPYWCYTVIASIFFLVGIPLFWCGIFPDDCAVWSVFPYLLFSVVGLWLLPKVCRKRPQEISPERLHCRYAFAVISFLLLFSALPMGIFFKTGADREMTLALKYNLITLGQKLRQTPALDFSQIQHEIRGIDMSNHIAEYSDNECESVKCEQTNSQQESCPLECSEKSISPYDRSLLERSIHLSSLAKTMLYVSDNKPYRDFCKHTETPLTLEKIHKFIRKHSLSRLSNPVSISTLGLIRDQFPGTPFRWRYEPPPSIALDFQVPLKQSDSEKKADPQTKWVILRSYPPSSFGWPISDFPAKVHFWGSIVLIVFVPMLVMVPIFIVSRIFPILPKSSTEFPTEENSGPREGNYLIIGLPKSLEAYRQRYLPDDQWERVDCRQIKDQERWEGEDRVLTTDKAGIILDHFECQFGVPEFDQAKLKLLTALLDKEKNIHILSTLNPLKFDRKDDPEAFSRDQGDRPVAVSLRQWSQVFQSVTLHYYKEGNLEISHEPYYEAIWQARTVDQQITLYRLAEDGFVHAEDQDLQPFFALGLIKSKPDPYWLHKDFQKYVLIAAKRDGLDIIERIKRQSRWHVWKWPLAIVLVVLGMGLLLTQRELNNLVVLMLSGLPVILPTLPLLLSNLPKLIGSQKKAGKAA